MEMLSALEKKVEGLVSLIRKLKEENSILAQDKRHLEDRIAQLESSLLKENDCLNTERSNTRKAVDELISSIDALVEGGS